MDLTKLLGISLALFGLLNFLVLPRLTKAWKESRSLKKITKAGLLGATEFARDSALLASIIYMSFALLSIVLGFGFGGNVFALKWIVAASTHLYSYLNSVKKYWDAWFFVLPLMLIIYISWRKQRNDFSGEFDRLVDGEFDRLNVERGLNPNKWDQLQPDERMQALDSEIRNRGAELAKLAPTGSKDRERRQKLLGEISAFKERRSEADYERRVRLDQIGEVPNAPGERSTWKTFFLSRGFFSDLKGLSKLLSRATLALLSVALIGVAAGSGMTQTLWNKVVNLDDLRVQITKDSVAKQWETKSKSGPSGKLTEDDKRAIQHLADEFARALIQNPNWHPMSSEFRLTGEGQQALVRRTILRQVKLPEADGNNSAAFSDGLSGPEHEVLNDISSGGEEKTRVGRIIAEREGPQIKSVFGSKWEAAKDAILEHAKQYHEPLRINDLESSLVDRIVSATFDGLVPDFPYGEIGKQARSTMSTAMKKAVNEAVTTEFRHVVEDLADGKPYKETIEKVRTSEIPFAKSKVEELAVLMHDDHMPDTNMFRDDLHSKSGSWHPPASAPSGSGSSEPNILPKPGAGFTKTPSAAAEPASNEVASVIRGIAEVDTNNAQYSLQEESIDAIAEYEDHFPRSVESQSSTLLGRTLKEYRVAADAPMIERLAELKVTRAVSFSMLEGFSRVGGVLIGRDPDNPSERANIRDINWRLNGRAVTITLSDFAGTSYEFGPFDKSLVHQALAYAADGRPVAGTMTKANPLPQLKIHLHPAVVDTPLGCRVTEVDRLVDTYAGIQLPRRQEITQKYEQQLAIYNVAWAIRASALANAVGSKATPLGDKAKAVEQGYRNLAVAGLKQPDLFDPTSVFRRKPEFFDSSLVEAAKSCRQDSVEGFEQCLTNEFKSARALEKRDTTVLRRWLQGPATFEPWSGVREKTFRISKDLAFLRDDGHPSVDSSLWPFDFIVQIAFTSAPVSLPEKQQDQYVDERPLEFDEIKPQIQKMVAEGIAQHGKQAMFEDLKNFTILQRMFRMGIKGNLGPDFPLEKLIQLTTETSGDIPYFHTLRWNGSVTAQFEAYLQRASASGISAPWMTAAAEQGRRCARVLDHADARDLSESEAISCKFEEFRETARQQCPNGKDQTAPACRWREIADSATAMLSLRHIEATLGVLEDQRLSRGFQQCPPLNSATRGSDEAMTRLNQ